MKISKSGTGGGGKITGVYMGDPMSGKTHNLCTWPAPLIVGFDPDNQTAEKMPGVFNLSVDSFKEFNDHVMPYVRARELGKLVQEKLDLQEEPTIETFGVDTISIGATRLAQEIQGTNERLRVQDYGLLLQTLTSMTMQCVETAKEVQPGQRTYNVIFTTHLAPVTDDQGNVIRIRPQIMGQFKDLLPRLFGFAFLCEHRIGSRIVPGQPAQPTEEWIVRTVPPNDKYICGDRLGGGPNHNRLPPITGGTYPELMEAWKMEQHD